MTTTQTQLRRGTAAQVDAMTPVDGEVVVDQTNKRLCLGDGSSAGGIKLPNAPDIQKQSFIYSTVGGTANAITLTNSPVVGSYTNGLKLTFKATSTNTGATTVNVDGLGTRNLYKLSGTTLVALSGNELISGAIYDITYDGTQFQLTNSAGSSISVVTQVFTTSATYTSTANMKYCIVEAVGGGGGGGGSANKQGGGGGEYVRSVLSASTVGSSQAVTIGTGGTGGSGSSNATSGGNTSLGSLVIAIGGTRGFGVTVGNGAGGTGGTGQFKVAGQTGTEFAFYGKGGDSELGWGGNPTSSGTSSGIGNNGAGYGGGGGGQSTGGNGANGIIIITEYIG